MSDTPVSDMAARKIGACAARWKDGSLAALEFANEADALLDPLRKLERENAALRSDKERVMELVRLWETQWPTYPSTTGGAYGAAAVRCCIRELRAALDAARKEQP